MQPVSTHLENAVGRLQPSLDANGNEVLSAGSKVPTVSPLDLPAAAFQDALDRRSTNRVALMRWVRSALAENVDYGRIHIAGKDRCPLAKQGKAKLCKDKYHWSKPSLFKPGAEKICGMLGVTVHYPSLAEYERVAMEGRQLHQVVIRCELQEINGRVVADGVGARALKQDYGDLNKSLKMAEKSAHIDATLRMAGLSEVFTQDIEDMPQFSNEKRSPASETSEGNGKSVNENGNSSVRNELKPNKNMSYIDERQVNELESKIKELGIDRQRLMTWLNKSTANMKAGPVLHLSELTPELFATIGQRLSVWGRT